MARDKNLSTASLLPLIAVTVPRGLFRRKPATSPGDEDPEGECGGLRFDRCRGHLTLTAGGYALLRQWPVLSGNMGELAEIATLSLG
jgi:hypothetical protein